VYDQLGLVLKEPRAFGLVQQAPHQLTDALRSMRQKLREAMRELRHGQNEADREEELSEDFDHGAKLSKV
jgi:hypothetical protein